MSDVFCFLRLGGGGWVWLVCLSEEGEGGEEERGGEVGGGAEEGVWV